jgi:hypothetical protein
MDRDGQEFKRICHLPVVKDGALVGMIAETRSTAP